METVIKIQVRGALRWIEYSTGEYRTEFIRKNMNALEGKGLDDIIPFTMTFTVGGHEWGEMAGIVGGNKEDVLTALHSTASQVTSELLRKVN